MKLEQRSGVVEFNENEVTVTLDLRQSKKFHNTPFETESIDAELFVRSIESEAPILFNHKREQIVSDDYDVETNDGLVTVKVRLDERNVWANTILSLREKSQKRLGCSFGFKCLKDEIRNKHRVIKDLIVSEISILSCESAYPSAVRSLDVDVDDEIRNITMEELQEMIDKSIQKALEPKVEVEEQPKEEVKVEEQPKVEPKPIEVKVDFSEFKDNFNSFLEEIKGLLPKEEVKSEQKVEEKEEKQADVEPKEEVKPVEEPQKAPVDDEKVKANVEKYKQMLAELE